MGCPPGSQCHLPDGVEYCRDDELIVDGDGHVARLPECRGHGPCRVAEVNAPQEKRKLSCGKSKQTAPIRFMGECKREKVKS